MFGALKAKIHAMKERSANKKIFVQELMKAVEDGQLSLEEVGHLDALQASFNLTASETANARIAAYTRAFAVAKADARVTEEELTDLRRLQSYLGIQDALVQGTQQELARLRLLTEISDGHLPSTTVSGLVLQRSETAHWCEPATLLEERVVRRRYEGGTSGVSIRIMKGVSYRVGGYRGHSVAETGIVPVSTGDLVITSKRIVFNGDRKSFALKFDKLLGVEPYVDGIRLSAATGKPRLIQLRSPRNLDLVCAILSQAINGA